MAEEITSTDAFAKKAASGKFSIALYIVNSICLTAGLACMDMSLDKWSGYWAMQKVGWLLLLVGNVTNTWKAATSSSARPK